MWRDSEDLAADAERPPSAPDPSLPREHAGSQRLASSHVRQSASSVSSPSSETRGRPVAEGGRERPIQAGVGPMRLPEVPEDPTG